MDGERVRLPKDKATYLATLYGKAMDAAAEHPILGDRFAAEAVARIDYDFRALKLPRGGEITLPMRGLHFDRWTRYRKLVRHLRYEFPSPPSAGASRHG
jgi:O-methyltransferase involved in polyketide biosynthesis